MFESRKKTNREQVDKQKM